MKSAGVARGNSTTTSAENRRDEILKADPYYPHTVWRALFLALLLFLSTFGLTVLLVMAFWPQEITVKLLLQPAIYAVIYSGGQLLLHRFRVGRLEDWGRISRQR